MFPPVRSLVALPVVWCGACAAEAPSGIGEPGAPTPRMAPGPYAPGRVYLGRNGYVEFRPGTLPLVISVPHDGTLRPTEIPDRTDGSRSADALVAAMAGYISDTLATITGGRRPHFVFMRLHRIKLDANRDTVASGATGAYAAGVANGEYHSILDTAMALAHRQFGPAQHVDLHGNSHPQQMIELGYGLGSATLELSNAQLNSRPGLEDSSHVRVTSRRSPLSFAAFIRGSSSLGTLLANSGYVASPSAQTPSPGFSSFYGAVDHTGYTVRRHGCGILRRRPNPGDPTGQVCSVMMETPRSVGADTTVAARKRFAGATARALLAFLRAHYGYSPGAGGS